MFKATDEQLINRFKNLKTRLDISNILEIEDRSLRYFLYVKRTENLYKSFQIPKKHGGVRSISAPCEELKNIQRKLAYILQLIYEPKICTYGFVKNKNIVDNAKNHIKKQEILNIDLKDFFTQFHFGRVRGMFKAKPYSLGDEAATTIAQIVCYNGVLPQGAPTSPIITNMICVPLDNSLMRFAKKNGLTYTRYADDLTFSSYKGCIFENIVSYFNEQWVICLELQKIFEKHNMIINENKITLRNRQARQETTGIIVNRFPNVKREYFKNLRAILHKCETSGIYDVAKNYIDMGLCHNDDIIKNKDNPQSEELIINWFKNVVKGKINFVKQVKGSRSPSFFSLANKANKVFNDELFDLTYFDKINKILEKNVFILQEETVDKFNQGTAFYIEGLGLFTSYHVTEKDGFFQVYNATGEKSGKIVSRTLNLTMEDKKIDYALYSLKIDNTINLSIGDSSTLKPGDQVVIAGFPDYKKGDSITKQTCQIISNTKLFDAPFCKVSGRIVHGASGGIVLNLACEVIGIIKGGIVSLDEDIINDNQGFVPIHVVIEDLQKKGIY